MGGAESLASDGDAIATAFSVAASLAAGSAAAMIAWLLSETALRPAPPPARPWEVEALDSQRRREGRWVFALLGPFVDELAQARWLCSEEEEERLTRDLAVAALPVPYTPRIYLAAAVCEGAATAVGLAIVGFIVGWLPFWIVTGLGLGTFVYLARHQDLKSRAALNRAAIKRRLPFAVDLMALMVEAGAQLEQAIDTLVGETGSDVLSRELQQVARHLKGGRGMPQSLRPLAERLQDPDVEDFVNAVLRGYEGHGIADTLRTLASDMLLKRMQRLEEATAKAQVHIVYPGFLIMLACLILCMAPVAMLMRKQLLQM